MDGWRRCKKPCVFLSAIPSDVCGAIIERKLVGYVCKLEIPPHAIYDNSEVPLCAFPD
jgi:hypothetical protein